MKLTFGERLQILRKRAGLRQPELSEAVCMSRSMIAMLETDRGRLGVQHVLAFCRALKCSPNELFGWEEEQEKWLSEQEPTS